MAEIPSYPEFWRSAQREELAVWNKTAHAPLDLIGEIADVLELVKFGEESYLPKAESAIELGIGPLGIGWASFVDVRMALAVDPLPRLTAETPSRELNAFVQTLQARVQYVQGDATKPLPVDPESFDLVICDNVIDHTQDPVSVLREARRLVKSTGHLLFGVNVFSRLGLLKWRHVTRRLYPRSPNTVCHPHSFDASQVLTLFVNTGWIPIGTHQNVSRVGAMVGRARRFRLVAKPRN